MSRLITMRKRSAYYGLKQLVGILRKHLPASFSMVEIGSYAGESTLMFAQGAGTVWAVDPWMPGYDPGDRASTTDLAEAEEAFDRRMAGRENVRKMKMTSAEAVGHFQDQSLDFVYIDGVHTYDGVKSDIALWLPKIKEMGGIAGHDFGGDTYTSVFRGNFPGVTHAVRESFGKPDLVCIDSSWLHWKRPMTGFEKMTYAWYTYVWYVSIVPNRLKKAVQRYFHTVFGRKHLKV